MALDESEQILLRLAREAATQRRALGGDALLFGGYLTGNRTS